MKRLIICLTLALGACSLPQEERAAIAPPVLESPAVMAAPVMVPCNINEVAAHDGIGGTGCR
ncbi:hypothetical protein [Loktanella sp. Alg231-35]|uniref:hypothetical protein n=1 Tax=Loktanella sp. Alg231-35 TaxID=1922220 RepID=UPI000D561048|nr:hypothetical protein [Loktanella sp. Alg231-35]